MKAEFGKSGIYQSKSSTFPIRRPAGLSLRYVRRYVPVFGRSECRCTAIIRVAGGGGSCHLFLSRSLHQVWPAASAAVQSRVRYKNKVITLHAQLLQQHAALMQHHNSKRQRLQQCRSYLRNKYIKSQATPYCRRRCHPPAAVPSCVR